VARTRTYDFAAGTEIQVRSDEAIDSGKAAEGQSFAAGVSREVRDHRGHRRRRARLARLTP